MAGPQSFHRQKKCFGITKDLGSSLKKEFLLSCTRRANNGVSRYPSLAGRRFPEYLTHLVKIGRIFLEFPLYLAEFFMRLFRLGYFTPYFC